MYRVVNKRHRRREGDVFVVYDVGAEIEPTDSELSAFPDRFEQIDDDLPFDPSDLTNDEVETAVAGLDQRDELAKVLDAERAGKNRTGAIDAIEERLNV